MLKAVHLIAAAKPTMMVTITELPKAGFTAIREVVKTFLKKLRRRRTPVEMVWTLEPHRNLDPDTDTERLHLHGLLRAPRTITPATVEECAAVKFGDTLAERLPRGERALADAAARTGRYLTKEVLAHPLGSEEIGEALLAHVERNGGRAVHVTRGFLEDRETGAQGLSAALKAQQGDGIWREAI